MKPEFTREQGLKLCRLARQALENELLGTRHDLQNLNEPAFGVERGCFVTLWTAKKELRGCIGNLEPLDDLFHSVARLALDAALQDSRFSPVRPAELGQLTTEVSILTLPQVAPGAHWQERVAQIRPHVDGVVISLGPQRATFLPQVWESLPDKEAFLTQLARKARIDQANWKQDKLVFSTYQATYFIEE